MFIFRIAPINLAKSNQVRYYLSMVIALLCASIASYFVALSSFFIIPLVTLFVMQTSVGNVLYQGVMRLFFILILMLGMLWLSSNQPLFYAFAQDIVFGAVIGIIANILIFPRRVDVEFRAAVIPVVQAYQHYFLALMDELLDGNVEKEHGTKLAVEKSMLNLPGWVYQRGFDSGLQKGYQFFVTKVESVGDILFSMHHLVRYSYDEHLVAELRSSMAPCIEHIKQFFSFISARMSLHSPVEKLDDFTKELDDLEKNFQQIVPFDLDLIDIRQDYVYFAELIYQLNELRTLLLKLIQALRPQS